MHSQTISSRLISFAHLYSLFIAILFFSILSLFQLYFMLNATHLLATILPVALLISFGLTNVLIKMPDKAKPWLIILVIFLLSGIYSFLLFDKAGDGRWYHQETIILIKSGWNPLLSSSFKQILLTDQFIQSRTFPIASELLAASFDCTFGHIQIGKIINILFAIYCLSIAFIAIDKLFKLDIKYSLLISGYIALNPIVMSQLQSFYLDGNLFCCFTILLFSILAWLYTSENKYFWLINIIVSFTILANLKMTGLVFGIAIILVATSIYIYVNKKFPKFYFNLILYLIPSTVFLGWHPYIQNLIYGRNIFWPILGANALSNFNEISQYARLPRLLLYILAYGTPYPMEISNLFVPALKPFVRTDTIIGALGPFFSLMLILGIYYSIKYFCKSFGQIRNSLIMQTLASMAIIVVITLAINPASWWAKYSPQIILLPAIGFIILCLNKTRWWNRYYLVIVGMITINSGLFFGGSLILTAYRSYKLYAMESFCRTNQCQFEINHTLFNFSFKNQLQEDKIPLNIITNCTNKKIIWTDVQIPNARPNRVCI